MESSSEVTYAFGNLNFLFDLLLKLLTKDLGCLQRFFLKSHAEFLAVRQNLVSEPDEVIHRL